MLKRTDLSNAKELSDLEMKKILGGYDGTSCDCNSADDCANKDNKVCGRADCTSSSYAGLCQSQ